MRKKQEEEQWRPDGWAVVAGMGATMLTSSFHRGTTNWFFLLVFLIGSLRPVDAQTKELFVFTLCVYGRGASICGVFFVENNSLSLILHVAAGNNQVYHLNNSFYSKYQ